VPAHDRAHRDGVRQLGQLGVVAQPGAVFGVCQSLVEPRPREQTPSHLALELCEVALAASLLGREAVVQVR